MTTLSVVIPAYNEENGIAEIANRVLAMRDGLRDVGVGTLELLVVDDGSRDKTAAIANSIDGVTLIQHPTNKGYGAALKTGFHQAAGDLIGFLDADGTYPPEHFPKLCVAALNGSDLVIGSRMAGAETGMPITRKVGNLFFANLLSLIGNKKVTDSASGMRVFKRHILEVVSPLPDGLNLTPVMSTRAVHENVAIKEIPIPYSERIGASKLSVVHDGSLFLRSMIWTALSYNPVRILGLIATVLLGIAALIGLGIVVQRVRGVTFLGPWAVSAVFTAVICSVAGISLFSLGATFNYLVALFHERPIRQGLFGKPIFTPSLDVHFGWMGALSFMFGLAIAVVSIVLGVGGWELARLWFYLLGSTVFIMVGIQLIISWVLMRTLEELSARGDKAK